MQHEEIVTELAKALSKIADALPRATLATRLYRTPRMRLAAVRLWASVLDLFTRALHWMSKGKLSHAMGSVLKPWSLSFKDTLRDCETNALIVQLEAESAMQAELRDLHILQQATHQQLIQTQALLAKSISGARMILFML